MAHTLSPWSYPADWVAIVQDTTLKAILKWSSPSDFGASPQLEVFEESVACAVQKSVFQRLELGTNQLCSQYMSEFRFGFRTWMGLGLDTLIQEKVVNVSEAVVSPDDRVNWLPVWEQLTHQSLGTNKGAPLGCWDLGSAHKQPVHPMFIHGPKQYIFIKKKINKMCFESFKLISLLYKFNGWITSAIHNESFLDI